MKVKRNQITNYPAIFVIFILCLNFLAACSKPEDKNPETLISNKGLLLARTISTRYPYRNAGSENESKVAALIEENLKDMGFSPKLSEFTFDEEEGKSVNISVLIEGQGFTEDEDDQDGEAEVFRKKALIIAHYDTPFTLEDYLENPRYDGIHDNASGVGALLSIADSIKKMQFGYDIEIVFLGAGEEDFAGAKHYIKESSAANLADIDVVYCIDSIYAGDKLYAHAGLNSLEEGKKYLKRRKLYELSEVAIANGIDLRLNESDLDVDIFGDGEEVVYREISKTQSDYSPFDDLGIACVFIESYEYFASSEEGQMESKNPYFADTGGKIKGTAFDSSVFLNEILESERLEKRIKDVAFLVTLALEKGIYRDPYAD